MSQESRYKHNFKICPECGAEVSRKAIKCWGCDISLLEAAQKYNAEDVNKNAPKPKLVRLLSGLFFFIFDRKKFVLALKILLLVTVLVYFTVFVSRIGNGKHLVGKAFLSGATVASHMYVIPLSKLFGMETPVAAPFRWARNALYDLGAANMPKDDAQIYIWWFVIKYTEYIETVFPLVIDYRYGSSQVPINLKRTYEWQEEARKTLVPLATLKIEDPYFRERRLNTWNAIIYNYIPSMGYLTQGQLVLKGVEPGKEIYVEEDFEKYVEECKRVLKLYLAFLTYTKTKEPESYDYFFEKTNRQISDPTIKWWMAKEVLYSQYHKKEPFDCDSVYVEMFAETYRDVLARKYTSEGMSTAFMFGLGPVEKAILEQCSNNPQLLETKKLMIKEFSTF